jgi:hypothetical protein
MPNGKKIDRKPAIWKSILSHNMLPPSDDDFYDSEWFQWLERINTGFESEKERLEEELEGASEEYAEILSDDYCQAEQISSNMYAALIVSVWAKTEHFFWNLCRYCECFGLPSIDKNANIECYAKYFDDNLRIKLHSINNNQTANFLRVLSNAFKHNNGWYRPDSYPVDKMLAAKYEISEDKPIKYIVLPIKELILNAGIFCQELLNKTETALKQRKDGK